MALGFDGFDREAVGNWPPKIRRITLQKIDDLTAEGLKRVGVGGDPPDELPSPLAPPRVLWKEESRLMPPPSCSGLAVGAVALEQFTPHCKS